MDVYVIIETKQTISGYELENKITRIPGIYISRKEAIKKSKRIIKRARKKYKLKELYNTEEFFKERDFVISYAGDGFSEEFGYQIEIKKMKLNMKGEK